MKTLALYLPQFHRVPENDEWWGEGFTEWTAVKGAEKLFEGHNQPRVPLNNNYYNLLEHDTMVWQADLMQEYRVDGMCMYHYWFKDGRRILEKPAENLLKWKDIQMPFCFCWANNTWIKSWSKFRNADIWSSIYETHETKDDTGILLKQSYGREKDWEEHFLYLLPFFKDKRYIKLDNKPVFVIYLPDDISCLWNMAGYFNKRAKQSGLQGIYFIGAGGKINQGLDAAFKRWPAGETASYDEMWDMILDYKIERDIKNYFCGFVDFDNSPRKGKDGLVIEGASPQKFYKYFKKLYQKSIGLNNEFIFINAWNEWGEGMYLEPDEKYGFGYLESLKKAIVECESEQKSDECNGIEINYYSEEEMKQKIAIQNISRHDSLLHNWLCLKEDGADFSAYLKKYGYQNIAIYGMGKLGQHLLRELEGSEIQVKFGIDKKKENIICGISIYNPKEKMPKVDAVIITVMDQYAKIAGALWENMDCPMITLEEIIRELMLQ